MSGGKLMTANCPTSLPFKVRLRKPLLISCRQSFRLMKESNRTCSDDQLTAFDLYTRARNIQLGTTIRSTEKTDLLNVVDLLNQAVGQDAAFFDAYCQLAYAHDSLYFTGYDHTPARLALAEAAVHTAFRLRPEAGEAHLARARNLYYGYLEYDGALAELEAARQSLPNNARLFELMGYILRRQGRWDESTGNLETGN